MGKKRVYILIGVAVSIIVASSCFLIGSIFSDKDSNSISNKDVLKVSTDTDDYNENVNNDEKEEKIDNSSDKILEKNNSVNNNVTSNKKDSIKSGSNNLTNKDDSKRDSQTVNNDDIKDNNIQKPTDNNGDIIGNDYIIKIEDINKKPDNIVTNPSNHKTLACGISENEEGINVSQSYILHFYDDKFSKASLVETVVLDESLLEYMTLEEYKKELDNNLKNDDDLKGLSMQISDNEKDTVTITVGFDAEDASKILGIDLGLATFEDMKNSLEEDGYICR